MAKNIMADVKRHGKVRRLLSAKTMVVLLVLVVGATVLWWVVYQKYAVRVVNQGNTQPYKDPLEAAQKIDQNYIKADQIASEEGYEAGAKFLESLVNSQSDQADKATTYLQASVLAYNKQKYQDSYNFAKQAEASKPTNVSAQSMATAAAKLGHTAEAIELYTLALSRITEKGQSVDTDRRSIQKEINRLRGGV